MLILLGLLRMGDLKALRLQHFELLGWERQSHQAGIVVAALLAAIPVLQFNTRLAQATYALATRGIAPYEVIGAQPLGTCSALQESLAPHPVICRTIARTG